LAIDTKAAPVIRNALRLIVDNRRFFVGISRIAYVSLTIFAFVKFLTDDVGILVLPLAFASLVLSLVIGTVLAVATHRYVILGKIKNEISLYTGIGIRELMFAAVGLLISLFMGLVVAIVLSSTILNFLSASLGSTISFLFIPAILFSLYFFAPYLLIFPFIAIDKLPVFRQALPDLRNYRPLIFKALLSTFILYLIPLLTLVTLFAQVKGSLLFIVHSGVVAVVITAYDILGTFFFVVVASLLYKKIADDVIQKRVGEST
jgi:hypothetical protein